MFSLLQLILSFYNETYTQRGNPLDPTSMTFIWSLTTALFLPGGMIGAFSAGYLADKFGRYTEYYLLLDLRKAFDTLLRKPCKVFLRCFSEVSYETWQTNAVIGVRRIKINLYIHKKLELSKAFDIVASMPCCKLTCFSEKKPRCSVTFLRLLAPLFQRVAWLPRHRNS